ncbi:hypothetical protein CFK39_02960 [Brachybacterium avium]|uniref:Uncharacterized protein n=1 Tax=Brachybacterium avium TaxID=2017485 RepID=A0A220UAL5_9MICO|nr:hypothetical protein CFK39_02960 [Brachybacterium avium]
MKPTWAPRVVAVSSSPEPTTAAEVIMPGPRKRSFPPSRRGGSVICEPSIRYGSISAPSVVVRGELTVSAVLGGGAVVDIDGSPRGLDGMAEVPRDRCATVQLRAATYQIGR